MPYGRRTGGFNLVEMLVAIALIVTLTAGMLLPGMWQRSEQVAEIDQSQSGTGLTGIYYSGPNFTGSSNTRVDEQINFNWNDHTPSLLDKANDFSVTWVGMLRSEFDEPYTLYLEANDGVRLFVDTRTIIDAWETQKHQTHQQVIDLSPTKPVSLTLNLQKRGRSASIRLYWSSPSTPKQLIPSSNLFPAIRDNVTDQRPD
jgi:hypothetical protein